MEGDVKTLRQRGVKTYYFYPRPPDGGRRVSFYLVHPTPFISIHALRMEGDKVNV